MRHKFLTVGLAAFAVLSIIGGLKAQALVKDGEEIADAKLFAAAHAEGRVDLLGTYPSENLKPVLKQFEKDTGLALDYVRLPTAKMYDRVLAEFAAGKLDADYADLTDLTLIKGWMERGVLAEHKVPAFDKIQRELRDDRGRWYFIVRPISVATVNTAMLKEADYPKRWADLLTPKYKGMIGLAHLDAGGSAATLYAFLRKIDPQAWEKLAANEPRIYATGAPVQNDLVRGRIAIGITGAAGITQQIDNGAPLKIMFMEEGLAAFGAMGNVTTTAKHPNAARVWINYVTSKYGSTLMSKTGSYGTHMDSPAPQAGGYTFPPQDKVFNVGIDEWERIMANYPTEWRAVFEKQK